MSPTATLSKMEEFGANFDQKVVSWIETLSAKSEVMKDTECEIVVSYHALALITYSYVTHRYSRSAINRR